MQYHPRSMPDLTAIAERDYSRQHMTRHKTEEQVREIADLLNNGEQTRRDHDDCPSGIDHKRRLWVALNDAGTWVSWHCHKCGQQGSLKRKKKMGGHRTSPKVIHTSLDNKLGSGQGQYNTGQRVYEISAWPLDYRNWLLRYLSPSYVEQLGVFYAPYLPVVNTRRVEQRLVLPIYDQDKRLCHFAARGSFPKYREVCLREGFKYKGVFDRSSAKVMGETTNVVLTEDWVSAAKVSLVEGCIGVPLWGTSLDVPAFLKEWKYRTQSVIIWLDNDNRVVRQRATEMSKQLGTMFKTKVVRGVADPKLCDRTRIEKETR